MEKVLQGGSQEPESRSQELKVRRSEILYFGSLASGSFKLLFLLERPFVFDRLRSLSRIGNLLDDPAVHVGEHLRR